MRRGYNSGILVLTTGLMASCATSKPPSCEGLGTVHVVTSEVPDGTPSFAVANVPGEDRIARLTCESDRGSAIAARELAYRYEMGIGVAANQERAAQLYARAAAEVPAFTQVYAPPVTLGGRGSVVLIPNPAGTRGDAEAQYRLARMYLEGRGVVPDQARAMRLLGMAARQNHPAAAEALRSLQAS